jgi:putative ABC transport system permease protein
MGRSRGGPRLAKSGGMTVRQDVRYALRLLAKTPTFAIVAVLTLGLAIAANTVVFSVVNAVMLKPLPYRAPEQLVRIDTQFPTQGFDKFWVSGTEYLGLLRDARSYDGLAAWTLDRVNLTGGQEPIAAEAVAVTASLGPLLGVAPALGRFFDEGEDTPGDPRVVVISDALWRRTFGADPGVVGRTVHMDAIPVTVVGIMPKGFDFPRAGTDVWLPLRLDAKKARPSNHYLTLTGRLKPGVTLAAARAETVMLGNAWHEADPKGHTIGPKHPMVVASLAEDLVAPVRPALLTLEAAVLFVLLIACANISNLLLARAEARSGEIAVRAALGASRARLARLFLTESVVLGLLGGAAGVAMASWGLDGVVALLPEGIPRAQEIGIDGSVLLFALGVSMGTSLVFGLSPILHARANLGEALRGATQRAVGSGKKQLFRRALVVVEVGLAIVLVAGAGLMARSFARLSQVSLGFEPRGLVTLDFQLDRRTYPKDEDVDAFLTRLRDGAATLPGVRAAALFEGAPPARPVVANDFEIVGRMQSKTDPPFVIDYWQIMSEDGLATLGARLVSGRTLARTDVATTEPVVLVNEAFARKYFPGEDVLGKRVVVAPGAARDGQPDVVQTIVGVVADIKNGGVDAKVGTEVFVPMHQTILFAYAPRAMKLVVRTDGDPRALFGVMRAYVASADPTLPIAYLQTMDRVVAESIAKPRFVATLLAAFAAIALVMAAIGIYGVMAYTVERRTSELGIRMALGATATQLKRMLVTQGLGLAGAGVVVGLAAAFALTALLDRWLSPLLFEVGSLDPATYAVTAPLMIAVAAIACWVPARRATHIHPMAALRHE